MPRRYQDVAVRASKSTATSVLLNRETFSMRRILLAAVALGGLTALAGTGAIAAPSAAGVHVVPSRVLVTNVDYYYNHHHFHHRHWEHDHWRYY